MYTVCWVICCTWIVGAQWLYWTLLWWNIVCSLDVIPLRLFEWTVVRWQGLRTVCHQSLGTSSAIPSQKNEEEQQAKCDPNKAIPLHYHPLHEQSSSTSATDAPTLPPDVDMPACSCHTQSRHSSDVLLCTPGSSAVTWQVQLKALLLRKACIVCYKLAREQLTAQTYGAALNFARQSFYCFGTFYAVKFVHNLLMHCVFLVLFLHLWVSLVGFVIALP